MHSGQRRPRAGPRHARPRGDVPARPRRPRDRRSSASAPGTHELVALAAAPRGRQSASCRYQPRERLPQSLSAADVHFVGLARGPRRLRRAEPAVRDPRRRAAGDRRRRRRRARRRRSSRAVGCGVVVPPGRPELLAGAIRDAPRRRLRPRRDGRGAGARTSTRTADRASRSAATAASSQRGLAP